MKQGYHSIHHQLLFFDKCPIHKEKLVYLCDCSESYKIQSAGSEKAYRCHNCKQELDVPDIKDSILKIWSMPITKIRVKHNNIDKISIIDFYNYITNDNKKLNTLTIDNKGKKKLRELYLRGYTKESTEFHHKCIENNTSNIQSSLHQNIIKKYGKEIYIQNINSINNFFRTNINEYNSDIDIIATIFLLHDLLSVNKTRHLYNYDFELRIEHENSIISVLEYVNKILDYNVEDVLKLYICNEIIKERFNQIKRIIRKDKLIPAQDESLEHENTYPIFIVVKENNGNNLLYRCDM